MLTPVDGKAATVGNGVTIGFVAPSRAAVNESHRLALLTGGTDAGAPGLRDYGPKVYAAYGRGRDGSYLPPPAQIRTCGTTAYGSCLRFVTRSVPPDRDVHFWASVCRCLRDDQSVTTGAGYAGCVA